MCSDMKHTALFSLNDISYADQFAGELIRCDWDIIASSETVALLRKKGLPVEDIADYTGVHDDFGFPPTLHAKVEHALTGTSGQSIDLVYVIPYPLSAGNDVGGRTLLALAVKGGRIAVTSIEDMKSAVSEICRKGDVSAPLRSELADKACTAISQHYAALVQDKEKQDFLYGRFAIGLKNGENPYQIPASIFALEEKNDPLSLMNFKQVSGENPCFTNMADADCILKTMCLVAEAFRLNTSSQPYVCIAAKHGNPCGAAVSAEAPAQAIEQALFGDPRSIWGGEVISNFPIDKDLAEFLLASSRRKKSFGNASWMLDVIMAPMFTPDAVLILGKRKERKLLENSALGSPFVKKDGYSYRFVRGGFLRQPPATYILDLKECSWDGDGLKKADVASFIVAWAVAFSSNHGGNEVVLVKDGVLLGAGGGPSTVEAARVAVARAKESGHEIDGAVFAADAFFPFTDAPAILAKAGVRAGSVPSGGKHEQEIREFFRRKEITMAYLPEQYRGFCRH